MGVDEGVHFHFQHVAANQTIKKNNYNNSYEQNAAQKNKTIT